MLRAMCGTDVDDNVRAGRQCALRAALVCNGHYIWPFSRLNRRRRRRRGGRRRGRRGEGVWVHVVLSDREGDCKPGRQTLDPRP
eukprot:242128-Rhodomonas_salina.1